MKSELEKLGELCGIGDADAMLKLSTFLKERSDSDKHNLNRKGSNMWLLRAAIYGNRSAQEQVLKIKKDDKGWLFFRESIFPYENFIPGKRTGWYISGFSGRNLNAVGLFAFDPNEKYTISGLDKNRHIRVGEFISYDEPDECGFGYEEYYRYFYLDEFFQPLNPAADENQRQNNPCRELWMGFM